MSFKQLAAACYENVAALGEAVALLGLDKGIGRGRRGKPGKAAFIPKLTRPGFGETIQRQKRRHAKFIPRGPGHSS